MSLLIFTQLDELLLNSEAASNKSVIEAIAQLQSKNIPLIPISSRTRAETVDWMEKMGLNSPFIVEAGSGIFIPQSDSRFNTSTCEQLDNYYLNQLGSTYTEARAALKAVQEEISKILRGFGDFDEEGIQALIGTSSIARKAKAREFSEYFITPSRLEIEQLQQVAIEYGFKILPGDNLSLILGANADPVAAIKWLRQNYGATESNFRTVGLKSTSSNHTWLDSVDQTIAISNLESWIKAITQLDC